MFKPLLFRLSDMCAKSFQLCLTLYNPIYCSIVCQAPLSMGFSRQEYWSGLPCPPAGDLPDPGTESVSPEAPALQKDSLPLSHWGSLDFLTFSPKSSI